MNLDEAIKKQAAQLFAATHARRSNFAKIADADAAAVPQHIKDTKQRLRDEAEQQARALKEQLLPRLNQEFLGTLVMLSCYLGQDTEDGRVVNVIDTFQLAGTAPPPSHTEPCNFSKEG